MIYDAKTNKVRYTATKAACLGAAKPDVEEEYKQNCIECELSYLDDDFSRTFLIPTTPIPAAAPPETIHVLLKTSNSSPVPERNLPDRHLTTRPLYLYSFQENACHG